MKPILFDQYETAFTSHGLGTIADAASCEVTEEANGSYELVLTLPVTSKRAPLMLARRLILAKPNPCSGYPYDEPQPFRIYRGQKASKSLLRVYAHHISYDTAGVPIAPFTATSAAGAAVACNNKKLVTSPFTISTDLQTTGQLDIKVPTALRALLGTGQNTLLSVFGGDLFYNRFFIGLLASRGADNGYRVRYGVDLVDYRQEENVARTYSGVLPYWTDGETTVQGKVQYAPEAIGFVNVLPLDLSQQFSEQPTEADVEAAGRAKLNEPGFGQPEISMTLSFVSDADRGLRAPRELRLFDTVHVDFPKLGVFNVSSKVVRTRYDVLRERYVSVELGDPRASIAETLAKPIGPDKIADGAITATKLAGGSVGGGALSKGVKADIKDAKDTATDAAADAANALDTAGAANTLAGQAKDRADVAKDTADTANATANAANSKIENMIYNLQTSATFDDFKKKERPN